MSSGSEAAAVNKVLSNFILLDSSTRGPHISDRSEGGSFNFNWLHAQEHVSLPPACYSIAKWSLPNSPLSVGLCFWHMCVSSLCVNVWSLPPLAAFFLGEGTFLKACQAVNMCLFNAVEIAIGIYCRN